MKEEAEASITDGREPLEDDGYTATVMTNFDHFVDEAIAARLKESPTHFAQYTGYNFCGYVVWGGKWICEVWRYHRKEQTFSGDSLGQLMSSICEEYGYE